MPIIESRSIVVLPFLLICALCIVAGCSASGTEESARPEVPAADAWKPATFDVYAYFADHLLAPDHSGHEALTTGFQVRSISDESFDVGIDLVAESPHIEASIPTGSVRLSGPGDSREIPLTLRLRSGVPEGTTGYVQVRASRGEETHTLHVRFTALSARPHLTLGRLEGEVEEQAFKHTDGDPVEFLLRASNLGVASAEFPLSWDAPPGWEVRFLDGAGDPADAVTVEGLTPNYLIERHTPFRAVVCPPANLPENEPAEIVLRLGPGAASGAGADALTVRVMKRGLLHATNALAGPFPHPHRVYPDRAGRAHTTFVLRVRNPGPDATAVQLGTHGLPEGWRAVLDRTAVPDLPAGGTEEVVLRVYPSAGASAGEEALFQVRAALDGGETDRVDLGVKVAAFPKVYFWAVDSMDAAYLGLNRAGTGEGLGSDWLMPNVHEFLNDGIHYRDAHVHLPSVTDTNHSNALAGTWTGTLGIYQVSGTYLGTDAHQRIYTCPMTHSLMRYGPKGKRVDRIYELAKRRDPDVLCAILSNKKWVSILHQDAEGTVDRAVHGSLYPPYVGPPTPFYLGTPPTPNLVQAAIHEIPWREILLPSLRGELADVLDLKRALQPVGAFIGSRPGEFCSDRWLAETFARMIIEEDPDVSYINLAELDDVQHLVGSAARPEEWEAGAAPGARGDRNRYNAVAERASALETLRKADDLFGAFVALLKERGVYEDSIIVVLADHGQQNYKHPRNGFELLDLRGILRQEGLLMGEDYELTVSLLDNAVVYAPDRASAARIERVLEAVEVEDPEEGPIQPLVVMNRREMISGIEETHPGRVGTRLTLPGELHSDYYTRPDPGGRSRQKWPDLFVFTTAHYVLMVNGDQLRGSMNPTGMSLGNAPEELVLSLIAGHGSFETTHVPLILKLPGAAPGAVVDERVHISDIAPTLYRHLGWQATPSVNGKPLPLGR